MREAYYGLGAGALGLLVIVLGEIRRHRQRVAAAKKIEAEYGWYGVEQLAARCERGCWYSRAIHQPYPRLCVKCGHPERTDRR